MRLEQAAPLVGGAWSGPGRDRRRLTSCERLQRVPEPGEEVVVDGLHVEIEAVDGGAVDVRHRRRAAAPARKRTRDDRTCSSSPALILLNGIFVAAEFAIVGAPRAAIERACAATATGSRERVQRGARGSASSRTATSPPRSSASRSRASASGMYGEHVLADGDLRLARAIAACRRGCVSHGFASVVAVAILTYFHIVVGEMVPKSLALQQAERMVLLDHAADAVDRERALSVRRRR